MRTMRRSVGIALIGIAVASCGNDGPGTTGTPVASSPDPSPTPTPTASASALSAVTATIEPYVLGTLTYTLAADTPSDKVAGIRDAMDFAVNHSNTLGAFSGNVSVVYGANTPTADASYHGQVRFGGSIGRRVALHELAHWFGSGTVGEWNANRDGKRFTGAIATARVRAFDGPGAIVNADGMHFWPYGLNYDNEFVDAQRNTQSVSAQIADMKIGSDATTAIAGIRRFQNRSSLFVVQGAGSGGAPVTASNATGGAQQWAVAFTDGFITLKNVDTGLILASLGVSGDNAGTEMATLQDNTRQQWEMIPTGEVGWFLIRNRETKNCLDNLGNLTAGAPLKLWGCGGNPNQQFRLVR
jgi:hypothetical protein